MMLYLVTLVHFTHPFQITGRNLGWVFNSKIGRTNTTQLWSYTV